MYPYNFRPEQLGINFREVFVIIPYEDKFNVLYDLLIVKAVEKASELLSLSGQQALYAKRASDDIGTTSGWLSVLEHLYTAQVVLGVLTDQNANVYYELGIAHATQQIQRQVLLLDSAEQPPFDLKDLIHFDYHFGGLDSDILPFAKKIADAITAFKIENERRINKARMVCGPYEFEVMMDWGEEPGVPIHTSPKGRSDYETKIFSKHGGNENYSKGSFERHVVAITNLCRIGLMGLNTAPPRYEQRDGGVILYVEFAYHWTDLGNCVLNLIGKIDRNEVNRRRSSLPAHFDR